MRIELNNAHALVCGASQGIGKAIAHELALLGARVTLLGRNEEVLREVLGSLPHARSGAHGYIAVDMARTADLAEALAPLSGTGVDILINNTGGPAPGPAHEAATEDFEAAFRLHVISYQTLVRALVPGMKARGQGRIVNVISTSVKQPLPNLGVSNTIRGAVANWGKTLANELGPFGITVNNVLPGATETERLAAIIRNKAAKTGISEEAVAQEMRHEVPMRRFARPEEIAAAVAFLVGPSGAYINGINLPVDGGRTACL